MDLRPYSPPWPRRLARLDSSGADVGLKPEVSNPEADLAARLTEDVSATVLPVVSAAELGALRRFQGLDRTYELVNQVLRRERGLDQLSDAEAEAVQEIITGLDALVRRWATPEPMRVYRGLRRADAVDLSASEVSRSFLSTSIARDVAINEFTAPPGGGGPALLELDIPAGADSIWVPPLGDQSLAYQGELILNPGIRIIPHRSRTVAGILIVDCEVQV